MIPYGKDWCPECGTYCPDRECPGCFPEPETEAAPGRERVPENVRDGYRDLKEAA